MSTFKNLLLLISLGLTLGARAESLATFERKAEMEPKNAKAQFNLGVVAMQNGALDKAEAAMAKTVKLDPSDAEAWELYGNVLLARKKLAPAVEAFETATGLNAKLQESWSGLGRASLVLGQPDDLKRAVRAFEQQAKLDSGNIAVWNNLGVARGRSGDDEGAIKAFEKAGPMGSRNLCPLYSKTGNFKAAEKACELASKIEGPKQGEAYYSLGFAQSRLGKASEARKSYEQALKKDKGLAAAHLTLGFMDYEQGKLDSALGRFQAALKVKGGDYPEAQYNQAVVLGDLGRWEQAADVYRGILKRDSDNEDAKVNLAVVVSSGSEALLNQGKDSYEAGDFGKATTAWNAALKLDPDNDQAKAFLKRVKGKSGGDKISKARSDARKRAANTLRAEDKKVLEQGRKALKEGKFAVAVRALEFYAKRDPKDAKAGADLRMARSRLRQQVDLALQSAGRKMVEEDKAGAKRLIEEALALDPNNARGNQMLKQLTGAKSAQKATAEEVKSLYFKGVDSYLDGKLDEAIATWKKVLALDPEHPDARRSVRQAQLEQEALKARKG